MDGRTATNKRVCICPGKMKNIIQNSLRAGHCSRHSTLDDTPLWLCLMLTAPRSLKTAHLLQTLHTIFYLASLPRLHAAYHTAYHTRGSCSHGFFHQTSHTRQTTPTVHRHRTTQRGRAGVSAAAMKGTC
ncbi:unnamed protein product, partial [Ectocarpus sp. 4 AP-2014]